MAEDKKANGPESAQSAPRSVHRSPNYPMFSLKEAIEKVRLIYQHEKKNFTTPAVIQKDIGYKEGTGPAGRAVSALKQYGLLEERGGTYGLSEKGFQLTYLEENGSERSRVIREAATNPIIFRELVDMYPSGLPSDATLRAHLIGRRGFNPSAVDDFIRIFKETIELAKIGTSEYTPDRPNENMGGGSTLEQQTQAAPSGKTQTHLFTWSLSIPRNVRAELRLSGEGLRKEDVGRLKKQIEALEASFDEESS